MKGGHQTRGRKGCKKYRGRKFDKENKVLFLAFRDKHAHTNIHFPTLLGSQSNVTLLVEMFIVSLLPQTCMRSSWDYWNHVKLLRTILSGHVCVVCCINPYDMYYSIYRKSMIIYYISTESLPSHLEHSLRSQSSLDSSSSVPNRSRAAINNKDTMAVSKKN